MNIVRSAWVLSLVLVLALAAGCAKKPTSDTATQAGAASSGSDMPDPRGIQESVVEDVPVAGAGTVPSGLQRIYFDFDQYVLTGSARTTLQDNADYLRANRGVRVVIEGHCDERGSDEYNLALGEKRALATKAFLVSLGVEANRLDVLSYGEERPLDPAHDEQAWAKNRRAEFVSR